MERTTTIGVVCTNPNPDSDANSFAFPNSFAYRNSFTYRNSLSKPNAIAYSNSEPNLHSLAIHFPNSHSNPFANADRYYYTHTDSYTHCYACVYTHADSYAYCYAYAHGFSYCYSEYHSDSERNFDSHPFGVTYSNTFTGPYGNCNPTTEPNAKPNSGHAHSNAIRDGISISNRYRYSNRITHLNTDSKRKRVANPQAQ